MASIGAFLKLVEGRNSGGTSIDELMRRAEEIEFQKWYAEKAAALGLDPNPDAPEHFYDYRGAFRAGATTDAADHWPSTFKRPGHPNQFVVIDGVLTDTITGLPVER